MASDTSMKSIEDSVRGAKCGNGGQWLSSFERSFTDAPVVDEKVPFDQVFVSKLRDEPQSKTSFLTQSFICDSTPHHRPNRSGSCNSTNSTNQATEQGPSCVEGVLEVDSERGR